MLLSGCHLRVLNLSVKSWDITTVLLTSRARREVRYRVDAADIGLVGGRLHQGRDCTVFCQQLYPLLPVWGPSSASLVA